MKKRYVKIPPPGCRPPKPRRPLPGWLKQTGIFIYILSWVVIVLTIGVFIGCQLTARAEPTEQTEQIELKQIVSEPTQAEPILLTMPEPEPYFALTEEETILVGQVVMAEAGGEGYTGQVAVAQCIRDTAIRDGLTVAEVIIEYKYTPDRKEPSESVQRAVRAVFDDGESAIDTAYYFYSPLNMPNGVSKWHEAQEFVTELGGHRFFR